MTAIPFRTAIRDALDEELANDERVILFGEDVAAAGGVFAVTPGLQERYGPARVFDTPISELAMTGAAYGAAILAGVGARYWSGVDQACDAVVRVAARVPPDAKSTALMQRHYQTFRRLYPALRQIAGNIG